MTKTKNSQHNADSKDFTENENNQNKECDSQCDASDSVNMADAEVENDNSSDAVASGAEQAADEWRDKYIRLSAEFDNYRKRTLKEKSTLAVLGGESVIKAILPVLDDMDRAVEAIQNASDIDSVRSGIELISQKMQDMLKSQGLKEIEAIGSELDTDFHEAVAQIPAPEKKAKGKIVDVAQKGYTYKDKVIRHAKVVVGS